METRRGTIRALVGGFAATLAVFWALTIVSNIMMVRAVHDDLRDRVVSEATSDAALDRCEAAPEAFLDAPLPYMRVQVASGEAAGMYWDRGPMRAEIIATGRTGPCARLVLLEEPFTLVPAWKHGGHLLMRAIAMATLIGMAWWAMIRPLQIRLGRMAAGSRAIAQNGFQGSLAPDGDPDLDAVADAFNEATKAARERMQELERRELATRQILGNVAHDVRTPLAALKAEVGRVVRGEDAPLVLGELEYLDALIANLALAVELQTTSDGRATHRFDVRPIVQHTAARFAILGRARGVAVEASTPDEPLWLDGDSIAITQAVANLVHNATQFARGNVAVIARADGPAVLIEVMDDGPGIELAEAPRLSERHFRGEGARTRHNGHGLGLAIANEVAARHGGRLTLERLEVGTRAVIRL